MDLLELESVKKLLKDSKECLIGVSGGIDSMAMLTWLVQHRSKFTTNFTVMHVDHGISENSSDWAKFVLDSCDLLQIRCNVVKVNLSGLDNNLEYAARKARYEAFCRSGADTIVLAHHANDQCESFLLKLFRGSGIRGLKAMSPKTSCWYNQSLDVVRPLLNITRDQIEYWATLNNVIGITDPSNKDLKYDRNYVRSEIWPVIKNRFDIADINTVRSISHLAEAWELTSNLADIDISSVTLPDGSMEWTKVKDLGYLRIKNLILRILDKEEIYGFGVGHIEQFAEGLIRANFDSRNELSLRGFTMNKIGKRIHVRKNNKHRSVA